MNYSQWFDSLPGRIQTVSVLNTKGCQDLGGLLLTFVSIWVLYCRVLKVSRAIGDKRLTRIKWALGAGLILVLAWTENFGFCVVVFAYCLLGFGGVLDGLAMIVAFGLGSENREMVAVLGLAVAYASRATLWFYALSKNVRKLPDYKEFLAALRPVDRRSKQARTTDANEDFDENERGCLVCWCSDVIRQQLPCPGKNQICLECLHRLHAAATYQCPFCCLPLYSNRTHTYNAACYRLMFVSLCATSAFNIVGIALKLYQGAYIRAATDIFVVLPFRWVTWKRLRPSTRADGSLLDEFPKFWTVVSVTIACWTGYWIRP